MAWNNLITDLVSKVYQNGNNEITGQKLQDFLSLFVGQSYDAFPQGKAFKNDTVTLADDKPRWWICADGKGAYTNYGGVVVEKDFAIIVYRGNFTLHEIDLNLSPLINNTPVATQPSQSGNTENLNSIVYHNGIKYFIDKNGNSATIAGVWKPYEIKNQTGSVLTIANATVADQEQYEDFEMQLEHAQVQRTNTPMFYDRNASDRMDYYVLQDSTDVKIHLGSPAKITDVFRIRLKQP